MCLKDIDFPVSTPFMADAAWRCGCSYCTDWLAATSIRVKQDENLERKVKRLERTMERLYLEMAMRTGQGLPAGSKEKHPRAPLAEGTGLTLPTSSQKHPKTVLADWE